MSPSNPTELQVAGVILSLATTLIVMHKFVIQRPRIQLRAEKERDFLFDDGVKSHLQFVVINDGFTFAEDTYVELRLPDWNFGEPRRRIDWDISVTAQDAEAENSENPEDEETETDQATDAEDVVRKADSVLDVRHDINTYFLAAGEVNHIFIEDTLYNGTEFPIFYGEIHLEQFETYQLEYSAGCRSYSPRKGVIEFDVGYDEIEVDHKPPRFLNAWYSYFKKIGADLRHFATTQLANKFGVDLTTDDARLLHSTIERENETPSETTVNPVAWVWVRPDLEDQRSVKVKGTLYIQHEGEEGIAGTVTFHAYSLDAGDYWETRPPQQQWGTNRFDYNKEYGGSPLEGALPMKMIVPEDMDSKPEVRVEWTVDSWVPRKGNLRGLSLRGCEFDDDLHAAKGTIQNSASVDVTVFVIAKLYTADDTLLTTPNSQITVEAGSEKDFTIQSDLDSEQNKRLSSCKCVMSNAL